MAKFHQHTHTQSVFRPRTAPFQSHLVPSLRFGSVQFSWVGFGPLLLLLLGQSASEKLEYATVAREPLHGSEEFKSPDNWSYGFVVWETSPQTVAAAAAG